MPRTCVLAADPGLPKNKRLSRRSLLAALPVSGLALTAHRAPASEGDTEIIRLLRQHYVIIEASNNHVYTSTGPDEDEEYLRLFLRPALELENKIMSMPSTCAADLCAKLILATDWGEQIEWRHDIKDIRQDARALIGVGFES